MLEAFKCCFTVPSIAAVLCPVTQALWSVLLRIVSHFRGMVLLGTATAGTALLVRSEGNVCLRWTQREPV